MLELLLNKASDSSLRILCLGSHSDDIEIGCGGTIIKIMRTFSNVDLLWVVFSADDIRKEEALKSASLFSEEALNKDIRILNFRDSFFPYHGTEIKEYFEGIKNFNPDLIFTHYREDRHQDHKLISDLTYNTYRDHLILEYEIPKYDGDIGNPNIFIPLSQEDSDNKINTIMKSFVSQIHRAWFKEETFLSTLYLRGNQSNSLSGLAEAFYCRKIVI